MPSDSSRDETEMEEPGMEDALADALGDSLPAAQLRRMRDVLLRRRTMVLEDIELTDDKEARERLQKQVLELDEHIAILNEEAAVNSFVEETVRFSQQVRKLQEG